MSKGYLVNEVRDGRFVRAWAEGRGRNRSIIVMIWNSGKDVGKADGDWEMPAALGVEAAVAQALLQTEGPK